MPNQLAGGGDGSVGCSLEYTVRGGGAASAEPREGGSRTEPRGSPASRPPHPPLPFFRPPLLVGSFVCLSISVALPSKGGGAALVDSSPCPPPPGIILEGEGGVRGRGVREGRGEPGGYKMFDFFIFLPFFFAGEGEDEESSPRTGGGTGCLEDVANH